MPTPAWRKKTFKSDWDKAWNPGDSIQLAIGQKDVTVTPLQMARFYAMIANGGKLVTPYVVSGVEQPGANRQQPVTLKQFPPDAAARRRRRSRPRCRPCATASGRRRTRRTAPRRASSARIPISIAGKTGTAEKVVNLPGYPVGHLEDQSWWCGYGPSDAAELVVCAVIENGGHGSSAAAPAALRVFEKYFNRRPPRQALVNVD